MRLVVDTDAFCKLGVCGLFRDTLNLLEADLLECGRLPALPFMLRRGALRRVYGPDLCGALGLIADTMPIAIQASEVWLDKLTPVQAIDPGEAQLFAAAAETGLIVVSGDKRALRALKDVDGFPEALSNQIVVLEAVLLALCDRLGPEDVRQRVQPLTATDKVIQVCFSACNQDPKAALLSYYGSLVAELTPLVLWDPRTEG